MHVSKFSLNHEVSNIRSTDACYVGWPSRPADTKLENASMRACVKRASPLIYRAWRLVEYEYFTFGLVEAKDSHETVGVGSGEGDEAQGVPQINAGPGASGVKQDSTPYPYVSAWNAHQCALHVMTVS